MATDKNSKSRSEAEIQAKLANLRAKGKPGPVELPGDLMVTAQPPTVAQLHSCHFGPIQCAACQTLCFDLLCLAQSSAANGRFSRELKKPVLKA